MSQLSDLPSTSAATPQAAGSGLRKLDAWMAAHPWHPRFAPLVVYVLLLHVMKQGQSLHPVVYPVLGLVQAGAVGWMLWRYRKLTPELSWRFHWAAVPVALLAAGAWMGLAAGMERLSPSWFTLHGESYFKQSGPGLAWTSMTARLLLMSVLVPMIEELPFRSALQRSFHTARDTGVFLLQVLGDLPVVGELVMRSEASRRADGVKRPMAAAFERYGLGEVSLFSLLAVGVAWSVISHPMRDWPGTLACAVLYGGLVGWTNRRKLAAGRRQGLGPVIWAHGLTNAVLWVYTIWSGDWRFL